MYPTIQNSTVNNDPWTLAPPATVAPANTVDPWAPVPSSAAAQTATPVAAEEKNFKQRNSTKTPESFLGENSSLVNLDNLLGTAHSSSKPG